MITREQIRELAQFQSAVGECAVSFYFQPQTPQNKSHREEAILAKDLVRSAQKTYANNGSKAALRADLDRILELAENLHGNQAHAKAVFASHAHGLWREFDLPPQMPGTQLIVKPHFYLKPLAVLLGAQPKLSVALVDRHRARFFDLRVDELREREGLFGTLSHRGRGDGFAGYQGGRAERSVDQEALRHFRNVADRLKTDLDLKVWERLIVGCADQTWKELESQLHTYVKQRLLGRFPIDLSARPEEIKSAASRTFREFLQTRRQELLNEVVDEARSNGRGALGLRRVLRAMEMGEVQTLLVGETFRAGAARCDACGHLDSHMTPICVVCGKKTSELEDVSDAVIASAIRRDIEMHYVAPSPEFEKVGNIAALLRFRSDQTTATKLAS
jgi:peptide subunit release factor 1 (eRF1)